MLVSVCGWFGSSTFSLPLSTPRCSGSGSSYFPCRCNTNTRLLMLMLMSVSGFLGSTSLQSAILLPRCCVPRKVTSFVRSQQAFDRRMACKDSLAVSTWCFHLDKIIHPLQGYRPNCVRQTQLGPILLVSPTAQVKWFIREIPHSRFPSQAELQDSAHVAIAVLIVRLEEPSDDVRIVPICLYSSLRDFPRTDTLLARRLLGTPETLIHRSVSF